MRPEAAAAAEPAPWTAEDGAASAARLRSLVSTDVAEAVRTPESDEFESAGEEKAERELAEIMEGMLPPKG